VITNGLNNWFIQRIRIKAVKILLVAWFISVASIIIALCLKAQLLVIFTIISKIFGPKYYFTLYNFRGVASSLGSYLLFVKVARYLYDKEARSQHTD
jgi:hypothetical protein